MKWLSEHRTLIVAAIFLVYVVLSLERGTPDPRLWLSVVGRPITSNIVTEAIGRIVSPGGGSNPPGTPPEEIPAADVYEDQECELLLSAVDWGSLYPGDSKTKTAYVKNTGTAPFTMALSTAKWSSTEAEQYITLSWDYEEDPAQAQALKSNDVVEVVLRLDVSPSITGVNDFSFDIIVSVTATASTEAAAP